jgi:hypothetical protein
MSKRYSTRTWTPISCLKQRKGWKFDDVTTACLIIHPTCLILRGKAIPVTGRGGPKGCETSRLPHFLDNRLTDGGEVVSLMRRPHFTPGKIPGTHFCWRLSRPQGHSEAGRIGIIEKIRWPLQDSKQQPSGLQHSASTNCATSVPRKFFNIKCNQSRFIRCPIPSCIHTSGRSDFNRRLAGKRTFLKMNMSRAAKCTLKLVNVEQFRHSRLRNKEG